MSKKLQDRRKAAGLSQAKLAAKVPMSLRTLQHLEVGRNDINKAAAITVYRISVALGCRVEDLLDIEDLEDDEEIPQF